MLILTLNVTIVLHHVLITGYTGAFIMKAALWNSIPGCIWVTENQFTFLLSGAWLKMVQIPLNLTQSQTLQAKVSSYQKEKKKLQRDFTEFKTHLQTFPPLRKISHALISHQTYVKVECDGEKCAPLVCFTLKQWWRKWLNNTWHSVLISSQWGTLGN